MIAWNELDRMLGLKPFTKKPRERGSMRGVSRSQPGVNAGPITAARQAR
jgi:hypothetical protein